MRRKPIELAAVATAAVPGLTPTAVSSAPDDPADFDSALLVDSEGKRWRVRSPRHAEASARLETEFMVLRAFVPAIRAELPFLMPTVAGTVRQGNLSTFVYSHLAGATCSVEELNSAPAGLAKEIGTALAAIHDLPRTLVSNADLPSYTPNEFRQRRLNELDQAATTGKIPPLLLRRWEHAMEDVSLWRFNPCVVHGDMHEDNILIGGDRVTAVTGWTDLRIGDPADDMAWLVASNEQAFVDAVQKQYVASRRDAPDAHLLRRAALSAEFALAQYMVKGLAAGDEDMMREAESMLNALAQDVAEYGGQPISVEPLPQPVAPPAGPQDAAVVPLKVVPAVSKVTLLPPVSVPAPAAAPTAGTAPAVQAPPVPPAPGNGTAPAVQAPPVPPAPGNGTAPAVQAPPVPPAPGNSNGMKDKVENERGPQLVADGSSAPGNASGPPAASGNVSISGAAASEEDSTQSITVVPAAPSAQAPGDAVTSAIAVVDAKSS